MDFTLSEEQRLLKDSLERFLDKEYDFARRRRIAGSAEGFSRESWASFAELGWLALPFPSAHGGYDCGAVETMLVMEAFGGALVIEPYLATVVLAGGLIADFATEAQQREILPAIAGGAAFLAFAHAEPQARFDLADIATTATRDGAGFLINGRKTLVYHAPIADHIVVPARTAGGQRECDGVSLFLVARDAPGLSLHPYPTADGQRAADLQFDNLRIDSDAVIGEIDSALPAIEQAVDRATAAVSAEALGIMQRLHDDTLDYLKTREQFGRPIGSFQALQHRMVDIHIELELARSMTCFATLRLNGDAPARAAAVSAAKAQTGDSGRFVGQQAVQLHGGIGMTDELPLSHAFRRLSAIGLMFGDTDHHLERMIRSDAL
jgi:alkylation response protein AidB-like acyl-CoA dehydrogenase